MKLNQFLSTLLTTGVQVTLVDLQTNTEIASMKASGYASLDDSIEAREVRQWFIINATTLKIILGDVIQDTSADTSDDTQNTGDNTNGG